MTSGKHLYSDVMYIKLGRLEMVCSSSCSIPTSRVVTKILLAAQLWHPGFVVDLQHQLVRTNMALTLSWFGSTNFYMRVQPAHSKHMHLKPVLFVTGWIL